MRALRILLVFSLLCGASGARAATFNDVYVFGDSLSDTRVGASNGRLWVEYFVPLLGLSYNESHNYAVAGSTTDQILDQVAVYELFNRADPNALYVVWGGGNDLLRGQSATEAADNVVAAISSLSAFGARNFLVPNLPDLGLIPRGLESGMSQLFTDAALSFNDRLGAGLTGSGAFIGDIFGLHRQVYTDPAAFGFVDVIHSCLDTLGALACSNEDIAYFFWDDIHPTTRGHELIGQYLIAAVPLPASALLLLSGFAPLTVWFLRGKRGTKTAAQSARPA